MLLVFCLGGFAFSHFRGVYYGNSSDERHLFEIFGWLNVVGIVIPGDPVPATGVVGLVDDVGEHRAGRTNGPDLDGTDDE